MDKRKEANQRVKDRLFSALVEFTGQKDWSKSSDLAKMHMGALAWGKYVVIHEAEFKSHAHRKEETHELSNFIFPHEYRPGHHQKPDRGRILEEVRGRMMEDIVLLETMKAADARRRVFKLQFAAGEFDMVIYDEEANNCDIFEIKHSGKQTPEQYRHLIDADKCRQTERRFGPIQGRYVLYRGEDASADNGVAYLKVEGYLKRLQGSEMLQEPGHGTLDMGPVL